MVSEVGNSTRKAFCPKDKCVKFEFQQLRKIDLTIGSYFEFRSRTSYHKKGYGGNLINQLNIYFNIKL